MRPGALAATAMTAVLLLSGCVASPPTPAPTENVASGLQKFYDQRVDWKSCESSGMTCASVTAPIDWATPSAGSLKLAVIRHVTTSSKRVGSLLINPGGPGGSGYDAVAQGLDYVTDAALREAFDVVGWDPRGVGRSTPVTCLDGPAMDAFLYAPPTAPEGSDAWLASRVPVEKAFGAACAKQTGPLLGHIDAESNARDMDLLRAVLGDAQLHYLGFSYGTFFGAHYAKLFPAKVGRLVLDGPVDPALSEPQDFTTQMAGFESSFRAYVADCLTTADCPFSGPLDAALAQAKALFQAAGTEGLTIADGRQLSLGVLGTAISYPLYDRDSWSSLSSMIAGLQKGSAKLAFSFADAYNGRSSNGTYDHSVDVYTAALCLDGAYPPDLAGTRATMDAIAQAAPTVGEILSYSDWVQVSIACQNWPYRNVLSAAPITAAGAAPIMVVGTTDDPATPYSGAVALADQLDSGVLVSRTGEGHTAYASGNACIDRTVDAYLVKGTVPVADPHC
ncbi:MAG: alpha/beta hydrolase [Lacisediminihabitans sp.]